MIHLRAILIPIFIFTLGNSLMGQETANLTVIVTNIKENSGTIKVGLYSTKDSWLENTYEGRTGKISNTQSKVVFENVPMGVYGISLYHDENDNGKLDTLFGFVPREKYACSNQAKGSFGPPKWKDAKFNLNITNQEITIKL